MPTFGGMCGHVVNRPRRWDGSAIAKEEVMKRRHPNISEETAAMQRREAMETRPQDRYSGRLKFTGCPECGSDFGMYSASREEMAVFLPRAIERLAPWYKEPGNDLVLYHECMFCNWRGSQGVPDDLEPLSVADVQTWRDRDPMAPDYAALAAEEPVSQIRDSRDSAGI